MLLEMYATVKDGKEERMLEITASGCERGPARAPLISSL
jgi:hypothetical protein